MDYYTPVLADGRAVPLSIHYITYRLNFIWPLSAKASRLQWALKNVGLAVSLACYVGTILGEVTFMSENSSDIPAMTTCFSTTLMGVQFFIRIVMLATRQRQFRALIEHFYRDIFFTPNDDPYLYKDIKMITRFIDICTKMYYLPLILILVMFTWDVFRLGLGAPSKPFIYAMSFHWYDAQAPLAYVITAIYTGWLTPSCVILMAADDYLMCMMLCHTSYRYKQLQRKLAQLYHEATEHVHGEATSDLHSAFRSKLYDIFRREQKLQRFVDVAKNHFTHQIFYCIYFGVLLLCVVAFQFQRTTIGIEWIKYIAWLCSQTAQFIIIGYFGQMLMDETAAMMNSYYMCQWESLLAHGSPRANKALMGDIQFAIANTSNTHAVLDGMKMFALTHSTVGTALRTAMSYFMFLNTMNDAN